MRWLLVCTLLLLGACSKSVYMPENSYALRVQELTTHGLDALHHGRFSSAENSLQRALRSAWLSADPLWIGRSQYYLGALLLAVNKEKEAAAILLEAAKNAKLAHDQATIWRSVFALALLQQQHENVGLNIPDLQVDMPADVYLSAARLAHMQGRVEDAKQAYLHVYALPVEAAEAVYAQGQALLGLALLARDGREVAQAVSWAEKVVVLSQQAGMPMLAAHAMLLQGELQQNTNKYERALAIYQALDDRMGQKDALRALLKLASSAPRKAKWQQAIKQLNK